MLIPELTSDASYTARSIRYGETYHSCHGAFTEARHVFVAASGLTERLATGRTARVLEIGFGLGLNCLLSADTAETRDGRLHYDAAEHELVDGTVWRRLDYARRLIRPALAERLARILEGPAAARARRRGGNAADGAKVPLVAALGKRTRLRLFCADATCTRWAVAHYDIVYLDAFSEAVNPECWQTPFMRRLHAALRPGGVLTTYSVRGSVRRALASAGFETAKAPGPPGKREMLIARRLPL